MRHASDNVDSLIEFLLTRYGSAWDAKYAMLDPEQVRNDWAGTLHGVANFRIRFALENLLADFPPNILQFKKLCDAAPPPPDLPKLGHRPKINPEGLRRLTAELAKVVEAQRKRNPRKWIEELRAIPERDRSPAQIAALRNIEADPPADSGVDAVALEKMKAEAARRVKAYQRAHPESRA